VETAEQVHAVRSRLPGDVSLGAMIETTRAVANAAAIAAAADFLSIGTNDLSHAVLGTDRFGGAAAPATHPLVLAAMAATARAAASAGKILEVCGEAASEPDSVPLLVGLGAGELSVGAARVGAVRNWIRALRYDELMQGRDAAGERLERNGRVVAIGPEA
jgi:phosphoenolpyruvate-protein kinase (PTS system EI component)